MNFATQIIIAVFGIFAPPVETQEVIVQRAVLERAAQCERGKGAPDPQLLRDLLDMEVAFGVPLSLRGMVLAAACHESGFNPKAKGDHKFSKQGKPKAIGLLQQWYWVEKFYMIDRTDPRQAARAWLTHWQRSLKKVDKDCRFRSAERRWVAAQVTSIRRPTKDGKARCFQQSHHFRRYKKWRKSWKHLLGPVV